MASPGENIVRRVLVSVEGEEKFSLDTRKAILARQAAKMRRRPLLDDND